MGLVVFRNSYQKSQNKDIPLSQLLNIKTSSDKQIFLGKTKPGKDQVIATGERLFGITASGANLKEANANIDEILPRKGIG